MKTFINICLALSLLCGGVLHAATLTVGYGTAASYIRIQTGPTTYVAADCTVGSGATAGRLTISESTIAALSGMSVPGTYPFVVYTGTASTSASDTAVAGGTLHWDGTQDTDDDNSKLSAITWSVVATCYAGSTTGINVTTSTANSTGADYGFAVVNSLSAGDGPVLTDNKGNKWEVIDTMTETWVESTTYECKNPRTGSGHTLTATSDGKSPSVFAIFTSGVRRNATHTDQSSSAHSDPTSTKQPGSITPSENNCLVLTTCLCGATGSLSVNESYTANALGMNASGNHIGGGLGYKIQTTATATNPTWTQGGSGSMGAGIYSFLPHIAGQRYITLDQWQDKQVLQREQNTTSKKVAVSGKYYGQVPSSVEIQTYKWRASGAVGALVSDYKPVSGLLCSGGSWSGEIVIDQGGWNRARPRSKDANGAVLATGLYTNNRWGVGINIAITGQSNGYKLFQDFGSADSDDDLTASFIAGAWGDVTGEGAIALANKVSTETGLPVGIWNYAVSGAGLVYDAGSGEWQSQSANKPWPLLQAGIQAAGSDLEYIVWQGCEADAENASFDADTLKTGFDTLYGRILAETPRTTATLPFITSMLGPLNDGTAARVSAIRTAIKEWSEETDGAELGGSLLDGTLVDSYHFGGTTYEHNGLRLAQTILHHADAANHVYTARGPEIFKAWRFTSSPIIYVQLFGLANAGIAEVDGTTDGGSLTGFEVSDDSFSTTETISSTAIEGNLVKLTLASTPADGATVAVRFAYGLTPTVTNYPYRISTPGGDTLGIPLLPASSVSVELRTAFASTTDTLAVGTLDKKFPLDIGYKLKTANGALSLARSTSNINLVSENETAATYSTYTNQNNGAVVWDDGSASTAEAIQTGGGGSSTVTDSDFENVPTTRIWKLITNSSNELVGDKTLVLKITTGEKTFAVDFANDLSVNGKITTVDSVTIDSGTADGIEFGTSGRERNLAKVRITGVTAGTYTIDCTVTDSEGNPHTGTVTLKVVE